MDAGNDRPLSEMRLLVADDNVFAADTLAELLRFELGCRVDVAYQGDQALQMAQAERPDAAVLDIRMPQLDGIEVARRLRRHDRAAGDGPVPRLVAVTGELGVNEKWNEIDANFDAAYAKPVDIDRLVGDLTRHWHGQSGRKAAVVFDVLECYTRAARDVMPLMAQAHHTVSFDCSDDLVAVEGDEAGLRAGLYRLMAALAEVLQKGFVVLHAEVQVGSTGDVLLTMAAAGTGELAPLARIEHVLRQLSLTLQRHERVGRPGLALEAGGSCESSGGRVSFNAEPGEGVLFRLEWRCGSCQQHLDASVCPAGARAWMIDSEGPAAEMLERRLQRFGWRVRGFASVDAAATALAEPSGATLPALVVMHETASAVQAFTRLARGLPPRTHALLLVAAGSLMLTVQRVASLQLRVQPLSPGDIGRLTEEAASRAGVLPANANSVWAAIGPRRRVLVVDDHEVNRMVASGLVKALGYDVVCASDGLDAIEQCKAAPPDVVLMDVHMPVLGGIDATRRLRELQRVGRVAPFAIVAATAAVDEETELACRAAGMDGFLAKPLRLAVMRDELQRVTNLMI